MKVITFFSRFAVVCNIAFLLFVLFGKLEARKPTTGNPDVVTSLPFFKDLVITLGVSAIVINLIMCLVYAVIVIIGRQRILPKWLVMLNFIFFIFQIYYFFFRQVQVL